MHFWLHSIDIRTTKVVDISDQKWYWQTTRPFPRERTGERATINKRIPRGNGPGCEHAVSLIVVIYKIYLFIVIVKTSQVKTTLQINIDILVLKKLFSRVNFSNIVG